jgi:hypothetical protein
MNTPAETRDIANLAIRLCDGKAGDYNNAAILSAVACAMHDEWRLKNYDDIDVGGKFLAEFGEYIIGRWRNTRSHDDIIQEFRNFVAAYKVAKRMTKHLTTQES